MAINFPTNPVDGQQYTNPSTGMIYRYSSTYGLWQNVFNSTNIEYNAWVQANTANITADLAYNQANLAFSRANVATNTFTSNVVVSVADNTNAALRVTQTGLGPSFIVQDSSNPDSSPFVIDADGRVGVGVSNVITTSYWTTGTTFLVRGLEASAVNANSHFFIGDYDTGSGGANTNIFAEVINYNEDGYGDGFGVRYAHGTRDNPVALESQDVIGYLYGAGWSGTQWNASQIKFKVNGPVTTSLVPIDIVFDTPGASEGARFTSSGNLLIGRSTSTVGQGVKVDVNGAINASAVLVNGTELTSGGGGASVFSANIGDASANTFNVAHGLNKQFVIPAVRENATGYYVYPDIKYTSANTIVFEFVSAPSTDQYVVIVLG